MWRRLTDSLNNPNAAELQGIVPLASGGTNADLSATGGVHKFLAQSSVGANISVVQPTMADLSGTLGVTQGGTGSNLSATGGASQVLRQSSAGAAISVGVLGDGNITKGVRNAAGQFLPAAVSNASMTMTGMAVTFTPTQTGVVRLTASGLASHTLGNLVPMHLNYGVGSPPGAGAAESGTILIYSQPLSPGGNPATFVLDWIITGLSVGTTYWTDVAINNNGGGTVAISWVSVIVVEI